MEQGRLFLAIALSFVVFFVWQALFVDKEPVDQQPTLQEETVSKTPGDTPRRIAKFGDKPASGVPYAAPAAVATAPQRQAKMITVDTPLYRIKISEQGGLFRSFLLKNYNEAAGEGAPMMELISPEVPAGSVQVGFAGNSVPGITGATFTSSLSTNRLKINDSPRNLTMRWVSPKGVVVEKFFQFSPETYLIQFSVTIKNGSAQSIQDQMTVALLNRLPTTASRFGFEGPSALIGKKVQQIKTKEIPEKSVYPGEIKWLAVQDRYFMGSLIPKKISEASMKLRLDKDNLLQADYVQPLMTIASETQKSFDFELYFGPKSVKVLKDTGRGLDKAVDFGMFDFIAKPCLWLMNFLYGFIPNYGVAIIILTIMMKGLLWPLGTKSYKSMNEMKRLQPIMSEIREKNKGDKKRMNEEIMGLYKTYKINPMGGCLPMVAQIPVFFALYRMLYEAIELRHAPFFWWITDLSAPDRLFRFDFAVPFMEQPYGIPVLTLVMGGTMFLQQKMTPSPGDPAQAKMMMLMPVVFTFIFINFSSGLVLYWLTNNILSISQQYYISKKLS